MKVFCINCKWFKDEDLYSGRPAKCTHPKSLVDTWKKKRGRRVSPELLNRNNDCRWFEKK